MMSHGVEPRFNQWRREPNTNLVREHEQPPIPTEFYIRLMSNRYDLWKKYNRRLPVKIDFMRRAGISASFTVLTTTSRC